MTDRDDRQNRPDSLADAALDALFAEARAERQRADAGDLPDLPLGGAEGLPPGLSARILADADTLMDQRASAAAGGKGRRPGPCACARLCPRPGARRRRWHGRRDDARRRLRSGRILGAGRPRHRRGPALVGLGAITLMGLWLGLMPPAAVQSGLDSAFGTGLSANPYLVDSTSTFEFLDSEG